MSDTFFALGPERILAAAEFQGRRATGRVLALNSLENRVYEVELEDGAEHGNRVVAKFYRPGRWSREAILDEHQFLAELHAEELPVVPPLDLGDGTLGCLGTGDASIFYAVFPKVRGRAPEEPSDEMLSRLGRLVARVHIVGARRAARSRPTLDADYYGARSRTLLLDGRHIPMELEARFIRVAEDIEAMCKSALAAIPTFRIHGDCHLGNLLWNEDGPLLVDFDDFLAGPPVQDLWLLAPGRDADAERRRALIASAYDEMRAFDFSTLRLVEALRALRILRYAAWIGERYADPAFVSAFPDFHEHAYWEREVGELERQRALIHESR